jgi:hypothetical protein
MKNHSLLLIAILVLTLLFSWHAIINWRSNSISEPKNLTTTSPLPINKESSETDHPLELIFVGDMMFDRYIRDTQGPSYENLLAKDLADYLKSSDGVMGNLEGSITDFDPVARYDQNNPDHFRFTFPLHSGYTTIISLPSQLAITT